MTPTILLVDVPSEESDSWKSFLEDRNFRVFLAGDAESALLLCLRHQPELVLLHDCLPDIRGIELCRRLKQNPLCQFIPVVVVSPSPESVDAASALDAGAAAFWGPPASLSEGLSRIRTLLQLKSYIDDQAMSVVVSLARSLEAKHSMTFRHSDRLTKLAIQIGENLGFDKAELEHLRLGCLLHDIGKVGIPDQILLKPSALNPEELQIMRRHPIMGANICAPLKSLRPVLPIIRYHHERLDGSGYPYGISGREIPQNACILKVADIYDALTNDRPYRKALSTDEALAVLHQEAECGWLDNSIVREVSEIVRPVPESVGRRHSMLLSYYSPSC